MRHLTEILRSNGQNPSNAYQSGKLEFDRKAGCLVYRPPGIRKANKIKLRLIKESK